MKKFKLLDMWISIGLIAIFLVYSLIRLDYTFLIGYCVIGVWQVISMMAHAANGWFCASGTPRFRYHIAVTIIITLALLGLLFESLLMLVLFPMLFAAPFMAVYYTWLCYREVYVKMQRPLAILK